MATNTGSMFSRIDQATSAVAFQPLRPGLSLAFKVRFIGVQEAARLGVLIQTMQQLIGRFRIPDEADMSGLEAAEMEAQRLTAEQQQQQIDSMIGQSMSVAKSVITHVQDLDNPEKWIPVVWVDSPDDEGDHDDHVCLYAERVIRSDGLANILQATLAPAVEVAEQWKPFPI